MWRSRHGTPHENWRSGRDHRKLCKYFKRYGECRRMDHCFDSHDKAEMLEQKYKITVVKDVIDRNGIKIITKSSLEGAETGCFVKDCREQVNENDIILLHYAYDNMEWFAKVQGFLGKAEENVEYEKDVDERKGFILSTEMYEIDRAFSVRRCEIRGHESCSEIGIHVMATAGKFNDRLKVLPAFHANVSEFISSSTGRSGTELKEGSIDPVISVFFHTGHQNTNEIAEPTVLALRVGTKYTPDNSLHNYELDTIFDYFVGNESANKILKWTSSYKFRARTDTIMLGVIIRNAINSYDRAVTRYMINTGNCIARYLKQKDESDEHERNAYAFQEHLIEAKRIFQEHGDVEKSGSSFLSYCKYLRAPPCLVSEDLANDCWLRKVITRKNVEELPPDDAMQVTVSSMTPLRMIQDLVNQQILLNTLIGSRQILYSEQDLIGIICIHLSTPNITRAVVGDITAENFKVSYMDMRKVGSLKRIRYRDLAGTSWEYKDEKNASIKWKGIECANPTQNTICCLALPEVERVEREWANYVATRREGATSSGYAEALDEMNEPSKIIESFNTAEGEIELVLQPRAIIRLQISKEDSLKNYGISFRMLNIGPNCNICLAHANDPVKVFMSDRHDLQYLLSVRRIEKLKVSDKKKQAFQTVLNDLKRETESNDTSEANVQAVREFLMSKLEADAEARIMPQVISAEIIWEGNYNGEGTFETEISLSEGDLLCIRKDLDDYVWNAHAVVLGKKCDKVKFAVCSLSQTDSEKNGEFVIEILRN